MDPTYVRGMREAKALLDEGVLSQGEYESEKARLLKQREEREAAGQRMEEPEVENGMGKETQVEEEEGVSGYCGGDDGMVAPSYVIVHGLGSVEDMLNVLEDIEKKLDSAANRSPQQTEGARVSTPTRQFKNKNEFEKLVQRMKADNARVVLRKLFLYQKDSPPTVMQEIWIQDKSNPDAQGPTGDPYKEYTVVHVHHHAAIASKGGLQDVDETKHLDVVNAINVRHLAPTGQHPYQKDNPFFNTYIEPSNGTSLKVYPTDWTCRVCRLSNYPKKESCRGPRCKGTRPDAAWCWEWKKDKSFDEGLAEILGQADQAWKSGKQWQSGSGKSMHRVAGDKSGDGIQTLRLEELQRQYTESRKKVCPSCGKIQCTCNAAKASEQSATTAEKAEREPPQVEVSQNTKPQHYVKADGSPLDRPDDAPWPFTILFVGVDNGEKTDPDLNLKREFEKIEQAYRESKVYHGSSRVLIKRLLFSKWSEVLLEIRKEAPTILSMGCHAQKGKGFELFRQIVDPEEMMDAIRSWNKSAREQSPPRPEIRIVVSNACDSEGHARVLSEVVDFAIGHDARVEDEDAINFSGIFFDCLFGCESLMDSFDQAKSCSKGYRLFSPERDPRHFYLVPSRHLSATASGSADTATSYEIVAYLKRRGLHRIAKRLSEELYLEEIDDLEFVKKERLDKLEWLEDVPRAKLLKLCREVTARLMSAADSEHSGDDTISQGASTPLAHSEGSYDGEGFESHGEDVLVAARNGGDCADFQEHMRYFLEDFHENLAFLDPEREIFHVSLRKDSLWGEWTMCMLLWIGFAQSNDATLDKSLRDKWLEVSKEPDQVIFLSTLTECLMHPDTTHPLWTLWMSDFKSCKCQKGNAAGIFFTDRVVQHALRGNEERKERWKKEVVNDWFNKTADAAPDFLIRANRFLREDLQRSIKGMSIFESLVETQSYVVFLKMSGLAASLLFGYLEARKLDFASGAGAAGGGRTLLHGFTSFVSSEGHAFSLSKTGVPASHVIVQGLQCLVHLAHTCWEVMGPVKTAQAFLIQDDLTIELDALVALSLKKKDDAPLEDGPDDNGSAAELHDKNRKEVKNIYNQARANSAAVLPMQEHEENSAAFSGSCSEATKPEQAGSATSAAVKHVPEVDAIQHDSESTRGQIDEIDDGERDSGSDGERDPGDTSEDCNEGSESAEDCADERHKQFRCEVSEKLKQEVVPLQAIFDIQEEVEHMCLRFDRRADFLSDFGSSEPFLIDGDALIMHALNNECLDWRNGGQILHHMYIVESFLQKLYVRGCQFDIFFLQGNELLFKCECASYILARTVVIHRLRSYAASRQLSGRGSFKVHVITGSWLDCMDCMDESNESNTSWGMLLKTFSPSFIMSYSGRYNDDHPMMFAVAQMTFVHSCLQARYIIITLQNLVFEGSRIYGFLFYPPASPFSSDTMLRCYNLIRPELQNLARRQGEDTQGAHSSVQLALDSTQGGDFRASIYLQALIRLLDAGRTPHDRTIGLVMVSIACVGAMQRLSLNDRAFVLPGDDQWPRCSALSFLHSSVSDLSETVTKFQNKLCCALADSFQQAKGISVDSTATDVFDGRLFSLILLQLVAGWTLPDWLGDTCVQHFTSCTEAGAALDFKIKSTHVILFTHDRPEDPVCDCWWAAAKRLLFISDDEREWAKSVLDRAKVARGTKSQLQHARLRPVGAGNMLSQVLGDVRERMLQFEDKDEDGLASGVGAFVQHHYHNTRALEEPDSFSCKPDKREYASLEMRLEEIEVRFSRGLITRTWIFDQMKEVERMFSDGSLKEGPYRRLKQMLDQCNAGRTTDKDYQSMRSKLIQRTNADRAAWELQQEQKRAKSERDFQKSLLEGSPVQEMRIAEKLTEQELEVRRCNALKRLETNAGSAVSEKPVIAEKLTEEKLKDRMCYALKRLGTTAGSAVSEKPELLDQSSVDSVWDDDTMSVASTTCNLNRVSNRDDDTMSVASSTMSVASSYQGGGGAKKGGGEVGKKAQLLKQNAERKEKVKVETDKAQFENLKKNTTADREHPEKYHAKFEEFASKETRSAIFALMARMHSLEFVAGCKYGMGTEERQKRIFVMSQRILRAHGSIMEGSHNEQLASILGRAGFHDMAEMLCGRLGGKRKPKIKFGGPSCCSIRFQLEHVPEHLGRPEGFKGDDRVQFAPDAWQQLLLDIVDSNNSALVVAPSGKRFISYYVMEQCLRVNDGDVVVYVAPTKALVNQVRAEISARFSKTYEKGGKLVSVFTMDFRDENFLDAQILVTVPECLGAIFLTGSRSNAMWTERIRHIIFDEVHCIGDKGGEVWEQLLLLMEPKNGFLALSATLGNVNHFYDWLQRVEEQRGRKVYKVLNNERWNDLFPWIWAHDKCAVVPLNPCWILNKLTAMKPLINAQTFPHDLKLLPEHCIMLHDALLPHIDESSRRNLDPKTFFQDRQDALWNLSMRDASAWEYQLKLSLFNMNPQHQQAVLVSLSTESEACFVKSDEMIGQLGEWEYVNRQIVPLTEDLKRRDMLPAVCFMLSRRGCLALARSLTKGFQAKEGAKRSEQWWSKRVKLETTLEELEKQYEKCKSKILLDENGEVISDGKGDIKSNINAIQQKLNEMDKPDPEFCVAQISDSDIKDAFGSMPLGRIWQDFCVPRHLIQALYRGIGVHQEGLPIKYRRAVEMLFRLKKLGVVFATRTLAMGRNMPAKTSVLVGDAVYLNAMSFRQMSGRAGRRGFDLRGNTVFMGVPSEKCFRLLKSDLPKLQGNLVMSNSLALRLLIRQSELSKLGDGVHESGVRSCKRLINFPMFNPFADTHKDSDLMGKQMAHCFRFSVEFLLRMGLLRHVDGPVGLEPNDLSAFVAHLFSMEPSNFAFLTLLLADEERALKLLCRPGRPNREEVVLSILCHIFCRQYLPKSVAHWAINNRSKTGPSCVVLDGLSKIGDLIGGRDGDQIREGQLVKNILQEHNAQALKTLAEYTACFVTAYGHELGLDKLPFSDGRHAEDVQVDEVSLGEEWQSLVLPRVSVRSPFVALSGHCDEFSSIQELCETTRGGLFLDPKMVPIFDLHDEETTFLNSYLLDFFKHGQKSALVRYNCIQEDDLFDDLQKFSLVLKALSAAMERRAGLYPDSRIPFDDKNVRGTFATISARFSEQLRKIGA